MIAIVVSFNIAISCLCLGAVWKLRQWQHILRRWAQALIVAEQNTDRVLYRAPYYILMGQSGIQQLYQHRSSIVMLRQQFLQLSVLLGFLQWIQNQMWHSSRNCPKPGQNR